MVTCRAHPVLALTLTPMIEFLNQYGFTLLAGFVGAALGSFLNVCVYRWPNDESVIRPRSRCPGCGTPVRWRDNLPVLGYFLLRGRCRACGVSLSLQYPLVEAMVALLWAGLAASMGPHPEVLRGGLFLTILLGIALTDARTYIIPDQFSLGGMLLGLALSPLPGGVDVVQSLSGAALGFGLLWLVAVLGKLAFKKDAMGGGDVKMMAMVGAFLGPAGVVLTLFLGALVGSVIFGPISWKTKKLVPFGIFLGVGAVVSYGWGGALVEWYVGRVLGLAP
ncbi:MAG: prepilin peptidase [Gemmatimonadetes bacterium]|nr:prepilin peptidase [Gemmatimonadota bacterium]